MCQNARSRGNEFGPRQHIFAVRRDLMDDASYKTLLAVARVAIHTRNGTIFDQIERAEAAELRGREPERLLIADESGDATRSDSGQAAPLVRTVDGTDLSGWNGFGGFQNGGRDYVVRLAGTKVTPHPWINVIANSNFGFHTSAEGASFTWSRNSRDFQLTPWTNDAGLEPPGRGNLRHDHASRKSFSPFAAVVRDASATYEARHGQGVSTFSSRRGSLRLELTQVVDPVDPVKISRLTIRNEGPVLGKAHRLRLCRMGARQQPGAERPQRRAPGSTRHRARSWRETPTASISAIALPSSRWQGASRSATADRHEFIGHDGTVERPAAVLRGAPLSGRVEAGLDACAAAASEVEVAAGGELTLLWLMGDAGSAEEASEFVQRHARRRLSGSPVAQRHRLARFPRHDPGRDARRRSRRHGQPLAALSEPVVPHPRTLGLLPGQRRLRLPRPAAGYARLPDP